MRSCSTVNIPLAIKIKPQMVIDYQLHKKQLEKEKARIDAEQLEAKKLEAEELAIAEEKENGDADGETNAIES